MVARLSPSRALQAVSALVALQRDRWVLWLAVGVLAGAAWHISSPSDPSYWFGAMLLAAGAPLAIAFAYWTTYAPDAWPARVRTALAGLCALFAAFGLGALAAEVRTRSVAQPAMVFDETPRAVEGWVTSIEPSDRGPRVRLLVRAIEGVDAPPRYVRMSVSAAGLLTPGRAARCYGVLGAPAGPMAPGAYDFARRAYFERLGATGFAFGRCRAAAFGPPENTLDRWCMKLAAMRQDLSAEIYAAAPGRGGAIAAALVAGDRSAIDIETNETLRDSGLGHLLSVSGVHMAVVGGLVFSALVFVFSLIPPIALRWPVKKIAASGALIALGAYLIVSGSSVPALRAYVMAAVAFGAILLDRPAISMRGLALAALVIVLLFPESVIEPGFQMSFAATMALVALFEVRDCSGNKDALPAPGPLIGGMQKLSNGIGGVIWVSLVAGLATDPFAIYHFQRFSTYALVANLAAAPIMTFLVAPAAGAAAVLAPFGWSDPALEVMAGSLDLVTAIGEAFGDRPEAVRALPRPPDAAMLLCVSALLLACLWRGALRWAAVPIFIGSLALYIAAPRPVLAFDADLRAVFARADDDTGADWTLIAPQRRSSYARDRLGAMLGLAPTQVERLAPPGGCGEALCLWRAEGGRALALIHEEAGFAAACRPGAIVLARIDAPADFVARCAPALLIDASGRAREGGGFIYEDGGMLRVERARTMHARRPWTPRGVAQEE